MNIHLGVKRSVYKGYFDILCLPPLCLKTVQRSLYTGAQDLQIGICLKKHFVLWSSCLWSEWSHLAGQIVVLPRSLDRYREDIIIIFICFIKYCIDANRWICQERKKANNIGCFVSGMNYKCIGSEVFFLFFQVGSLTFWHAICKKYLRMWCRLGFSVCSSDWILWNFDLRA